MHTVVIEQIYDFRLSDYDRSRRHAVKFHPLVLNSSHSYPMISWIVDKSEG